MLNVPIGNDLLALQKRVRNIITVALKDDDHMLLRQLWCLLRNAEMKLPHGDNQARLHKLRDWVALEMTELEIRQVPGIPTARSHKEQVALSTEKVRTAMDDEFQAGDVVELKDGSYPMTVGSVADGLALCSWSVEGRAHRHRYPISNLRAVPEPQELLQSPRRLAPPVEELPQVTRPS